MERGVIEYTTFSGVTLRVTPLSVITIQAIIERSKAEYPDFDDSPFREPVPHSAVPDATFIDLDNPEYQRLMADLQARRDAYTNRLFYELAVEFAETPGELKRLYGKRIEKLRSVLNLTDSDESILLFHIALERLEDQNIITRMIRDRVPLTEGEVADGLKIFRPDLQRNGFSAVARPASRLPAAGANPGHVVES